MSYFFLVLALGLSGFVSFFGLPIFISFILSYVPTGYIASLVIGLIPARCMRRSIVRCGCPAHSAISLNVSPFISNIIAYFPENVKCLNKKTLLLYKCEAEIGNILKILENFYKKLLDKVFELCDT